jgi:hypothetical protein
MEEVEKEVVVAYLKSYTGTCLKEIGRTRIRIVNVRPRAQSGTFRIKSVITTQLRLTVTCGF